MDFEESKKHSGAENISKNRKTLIGLFSLFITPVLIAYAAYFGNWFSGSNTAQGELIIQSQLTDIEDYAIYKSNGEIVTGKEFETLYWWILPLRESECDQVCVNLNLSTVNRTHLGLGKEVTRINQLVILEGGSGIDVGVFPRATSQFSTIGIKAIKNSHSGKQIDLPANYIYLIDPLGNIFMKYPLVRNKEDAPMVSSKLRKDILHLFKYSRLG